MNPDCLKKAKTEIDNLIIKPNAHLLQQGKSKWELFDYENSQSLTYLGYCINESLRIEPPVHISSGLCFTEDV